MNHYSSALEDETDVSTFLFRATNNKESFLAGQKLLLEELYKHDNKEKVES